MDYGYLVLGYFILLDQRVFRRFRYSDDPVGKLVSPFFEGKEYDLPEL